MPQLNLNFIDIPPAHRVAELGDIVGIHERLRDAIAIGYQGQSEPVCGRRVGARQGRRADAHQDIVAPSPGADGGGDRKAGSTSEIGRCRGRAGWCDARDEYPLPAVVEESTDGVGQPFARGAANYAIYVGSIPAAEFLQCSQDAATDQAFCQPTPAAPDQCRILPQDLRTNEVNNVAFLLSKVP